MKFLGTLLALAALAGPSFAQDKPKGPPPGRKDGGPKEGPPKGDKPCGKSPQDLAADFKAKGHKGDVEEHFRQHPDGVCHCFCGHEKPNKKDVGPREGGPKEGPPKGDKPCGKTPGQVAEEMKAKGHKGDVEEHFKQHPEGLCHCLCGHDKPKKEGAPKDGPPKEGGRDCGATIKQAVNESDVKHFKTQHPDGVCHCLCEHEWKGDNRKGNNGVGNGVDPQPPGKPPVNDGPGSAPGKPGRKGGDK